MSEREKVAAYEVFIEDMIHVFQERFSELNKNAKELTDYEKGRWSSYREVIDIIKTREELIGEMLVTE